jgi:DMSO reductase anchor subunit
MEEPALIIFTLLLQAAAGAAWWLAGLIPWLAGHGDPAGARALAAWGWPGVAGMAVAGVLASCGHLGVPANAWRAACHWRTSWLSREILAATTFTGLALAAAAAARAGLPGAWAQGLAAASGLILVHCMARAYRLGPVPAWNTPITPVVFFSTALLLGGGTLGVILASLPGHRAGPLEPVWSIWATAVVLLTSSNLILTGLWLAQLPEAMKARMLDRHRFLVAGRFGLALAGIGAVVLARSGGGQLPLRLGAILAMAGSEGFGRALFYSGRLAHGVYLYKG